MAKIIQITNCVIVITTNYQLHLQLFNITTQKNTITGTIGPFFTPCKNGLSYVNSHVMSTQITA